MSFWGPWITPPVQTTSGPLTSPAFNGGSVTNITETGDISDTDALNGVNPAGLGTRSSSGGSAFVPRDDPTFLHPAIETSLWLIARAAVQGTEYLPTFPPNAIDIEYDPTDTDSAAWVHWPITLAPTAFPITANFPGGAIATPPSDATELLKRMATADYTATDDGFRNFTVTPATTNSWYTPALLSARATIASFPVGGGTSSFALDLADLDTGGYAAFGECLNYIADGVVPAVQLFGNIGIQVTFTYQPRKYRFLLTGRPPLAHRQRRDGAATDGPPLAHIGTAGSRPPLAHRQSNP